MQSEIDPKTVEKLIAEESEKMMRQKGDYDKEKAIMKKLKEMQS
jgi:hypothetical protein